MTLRNRSAPAMIRFPHVSEAFSPRLGSGPVGARRVVARAHGARAAKPESRRRIPSHRLRLLPLDAAVVSVSRHSVAAARTDEHQRPRDRHRGRRDERRAAHLRRPLRRAACGRPTTTARTWQAIFEHQASTSIGDIAVAPSNPDIVWVGTGESNLFRASMAGRRHLQVDRRRHAPSRMPASPTRRRLRASSSTRRTLTWSTSRRPDTSGPTTRCAACSRRPTAGARGRRCSTAARAPARSISSWIPPTPNTLYAAMWQRVRRKWSDPARRAGLRGRRHLEDDRRRHSWTEANNGLPAAQFRGRIGIDVSPLQPECALRVRRQLRGRPAARAKASATPIRRPIIEARIKAAEIYRSDDNGETWRKVTENERLHDRPLGHLRLGVRPDSRRPDRREHDLHARPRPQRVARRRQDLHARSAACTAIITASGSTRRIRRCSTTSNDGGFYLSADAGKTWNLRTSRRAAMQFYNVTLDASTPAVGLRIDPGRTAAGAADRSERGPRQDSRGRMVERARAARARITPSTPPTPTSSIRTASTGTSRARTSRPAAGRGAPPAGGTRAGARPRPRRASRPSGRREDGEPRAARAVDGADHHVPARSGDDLRRVPVRLSFHQSRRDVGADQPGSDGNDPVADAAEELERDPVPDDHGPRRVAAPGAACSMRAPTTAGCT